MSAPSISEQHTKLKRLSELQRDWKLLFYRPYPKQREFHALGRTHRERILLAGNQLGKTYAAAMETAYHLTGLYPNWWDGHRYRRAPRLWVGNETSELTRDGPQRLLLGPIGQWQTGTIPAANIVDIKRARGVPDAVETILVKHEPTGTVSQCTFKAYKDGRTAWQTETLDGIWFDEEPPVDIYGEGLARTTTTGGPVWITFTPAKGLSQVVAKFWPRPMDAGKAFVLMNMHDALLAGHIAQKDYDAEINKYEEYERQYRVWGLPSVGTGLIYPVTDELITEDDRDYIPTHWKRIIGLDIGWDHPTAAVELAYDADADTIHVTREYRVAKQTPLIHATALKPWGAHPVAWPHDALQHDKGGSCEQIAKQYRDHGLAMLPNRAEFPDDRGNGVEAGILGILQYMQTGRFKVAKSLTAWHEERRGYHRKPNQQGVPRIVKERDDLMDATRYAFMMLRYARPIEVPEEPPDRYDRSRKRRRTGRTWMSR